MSKHWKPAVARSGRTPRRRRRGLSLRKARLALLGLLAVGLAYAVDLDVPEFGGATEPAELVRQAATEVLDHLVGQASEDVDETAQPAAVTVIDGDTFRYRGEKIRIADIDTPELKGRCAYERRLASQATNRLDELLHEGPFALHRNGRDEDRYGRKLRIVTSDGHSLGDQLVAEGLARTWTGRREPWC